MKHLVLFAMAALLAGWSSGCGDDDGADDDGSADSDSDNDSDSDTDSDSDSDADTDTDADGDIEEFCTVACDVCFMGNAPWQSLPADQCIPECIADFEDCPEEQIPEILECTGGPNCPAGMLDFGFCVAPYTCLLS
jgi:hypothetical protein